MKNPTALAAEWMAAKQAEADAVAKRRSIEDEMAEFLSLEETHDGTTTATVGQFQVKATQRLSRSVDASQIQAIAAQHKIGYAELQNLFRWKPEINATAWKTAPSDLTAILSQAITTKASRPTFSITIKE